MPSVCGSTRRLCHSPLPWAPDPCSLSDWGIFSSPPVLPLFSHPLSLPLWPLSLTLSTSCPDVTFLVNSSSHSFGKSYRFKRGRNRLRIYCTSVLYCFITDPMSCKCRQRPILKTHYPGYSKLSQGHGRPDWNQKETKRVLRSADLTAEGEFFM